MNSPGQDEATEKKNNIRQFNKRPGEICGPLVAAQRFARSHSGWRPGAVAVSRFKTGALSDITGAVHVESGTGQVPATATGEIGDQFRDLCWRHPFTHGKPGGDLLGTALGGGELFGQPCMHDPGSHDIGQYAPGRVGARQGLSGGMERGLGGGIGYVRGIGRAPLRRPARARAGGWW